jgi:hypothetical protein
MKVPFEELSYTLDANNLRLWTKEAERADNERGEALDISFPVAPTLTEMRLNLLATKVSTSVMQGSVTWLIEGISIEDAQ